LYERAHFMSGMYVFYLFYAQKRTPRRPHGGAFPADLKAAVYLVNPQAQRVLQVPNSLLIRTVAESYNLLPAIRQAISSVNSNQIALLVARRGIVLTTIGLAIGLLLSVPTVRLMSRLLYEALTWTAGQASGQAWTPP
jgi:hypothetical protein